MNCVFSVAKFYYSFIHCHYDKDDDTKRYHKTEIKRDSVGAIEFDENEIRNKILRNDRKSFILMNE